MMAWIPIAWGALKRAWVWRAWLIPVVLVVALGGAFAWARHLSSARDAAAAKAEQYKAAALSADAAIVEMQIHQEHIDAAVGAAHAAELARLAKSATIRQGVASAPPAPACPPDPAVLHGLELLRGETHG